MVTKIRLLFFLVVFLISFFLFPKLSIVNAGCAGSGMSCNAKNCKVFGTRAEDCGAYQNPPGGWQGVGTVYQCDTQPEAKAVCSGTVKNCPGTCNNSTCATTGACNCSDYNGWPEKCLGSNNSPVLYPWNSTCTYNYSTGLCQGKYCCAENPDTGYPYGGCGAYGNDRGHCVGSGCNWVAAPNSCDVASPCTGGTCTTECGDVVTCGPAPYYTAVYPVSVTTPDLTPNFSWVTNNPGGAGTYSNVNVYTDANALATCQNDVLTNGNNYTLQEGVTSAQNTIAPTIGFYCSGYGICPPEFQSGGSHTFQASRTYAWLVYGRFPDGTYHNSGCVSFNTPAYSCTISLSTATPLFPVGGSAQINAAVTTTGGATVGSIAWVSSAPSVGSIPTPTGAGIVTNSVTGVSVGSTNISATVNLSPSGYCNTTTPLALTIAPISWWQVSGGDVFGINVVSKIPGVCASNCYIDLAY